MHKLYAAAPLVFAAGAIGVLYTMVAWWRDVIKEAEYKHDHTRVVQISHRYGMILFIASEVMFFVAWFWAYFSTALFPADAHHFARTELLGGVWPPKGIETFDPWHLPLLNTLILLTSGTTVTLFGSAAFSTQTSYVCTVSNTADIASRLQVSNTDGSHFVITGQASVASASYICIGN